MESIDRRTLKLLEERSKALGVETRSPPIRYSDTRTGRDDFRNPGTLNPDASDLGFRQAAEDRDVAARLAAADQIDPDDPDPILINIFDALRIAQESAREFMTAEEEYVLAAIRVLIERHLWSPRLFNDTTVGVARSGTGSGADTTLRIINEMRARQRLPFGGQVEASWIYRATDQLRSASTEGYIQSSTLALTADIPLLRGAGMIAREDLIQAERNLIYAARRFERFRRQFLVDISNDFFSLLELQAVIESQETRLINQQRLLRRTEASVEAGRRAAFELAEVDNEVRATLSRLESLREQYRLNLDRFRIRLGLDTDQPIEIDRTPFFLPEPDITPDEAAALALEYRLDLQIQRDQLGDSRRALANARNRVLPDLDLTGRVGLDGDGASGLVYDFGETNYNVGVTFGLPLDREIERLGVRQASINLEQRRRSYEQFRDQVIVNARQSVRAIELARLQLTLAEERINITIQRLREQELKEDEISADDIIRAQDALTDAQNARDSELTNLRNAVLNFLLQTDQLRVAPDGTLLPLPGMGDPDQEPEIDTEPDREFESPGGVPTPEPNEENPEN
ncbi:MAG: TolC family protein [Phycisphaerales bacterium]|nr:TolC family protein [Phycisphaerales bacterium]